MIIAYEKAETDIMQRKPRDPKVDKLVTVRLISFSYFQAGMIIALAGLFNYFVVMGDYGFSPKSLPGLAAIWEKEDKVIIFNDKHGNAFERDYDYRINALRQAQTAVFVAIVLCQWGTLLMTKTRKLSLFQQGMKNWVSNIGILTETLLAVVLCYVPFIRKIFSTKPLAFNHWLTPLPFTAFMVVYDEVRKYLIRQQKWKKISSFVEEYSYY